MNKLVNLTLLFCCGVAPLHAGEDVLRFTNGDQLHGRYLGMADAESILWERKDVEGKVKFRLTEVRHVVKKSANLERQLPGFSNLGIMNGDTIPGEVIDLNEKRVIVKSPVAGTIEIPREYVGMIAPNPLGGKLLYYGPFDKEGWMMVDTKNPEGFPEFKEEEKDKFELSRWKFSGSGWYWDQKGYGTGLVRKTGMSDKSILKFDVSWKGRLSLAIGFHADFKKPDNAKQSDQDVFGPMGRGVSLPMIFGNSYTFQLYSNYVTIVKNSFNEEGRAISERLQGTSGAVRLGDAGKTTIEIRCDRKTGEIQIFVGDQFVGQWIEAGGDADAEGVYAGLGEGFGFLVQTGESPVKISEVMVSEWNGMPDSARSLQLADADVVLLANGRDRFSGKVVEIADKRLKIQSKFGDFILPMEDVSEVRFAKSELTEKEGEESDMVKVAFDPAGRISGKPIGGSEGKLKLSNELIGEVELDLSSARMLEFEEKGVFVDGWDEDS